MGSMAAQLLFPFLLPSLFIRLLIFAQGERKKVLCVEPFGVCRDTEFCTTDRRKEFS